MPEIHITRDKLLNLADIVAGLYGVSVAETDQYLKCVPSEFIRVNRDEPV